MKQLRLTTSKPCCFGSTDEPLVIPTDVTEIIHDEVKGDGAFLHGDVEELAGYDIPIFIDGNFGQLDLPTEEQNILMLLPSGEYSCKAELSNSIGSKNKYLIQLKNA